MTVVTCTKKQIVEINNTKSGLSNIILASKSHPKQKIEMAPYLSNIIKTKQAIDTMSMRDLSTNQLLRASIEDNEVDIITQCFIGINFVMPKDVQLRVWTLSRSLAHGLLWRSTTQWYLFSGSTQLLWSEL
jgi:glycine betaine/choline ABC-type transport system substrate-binding protein